MRGDSLLYSLFLLLFLPALAAGAVSATLEVDKKQVYVSEKVLVTLTLAGLADPFEDLKVDTGNTTGFIIVTPDLTANNSITTLGIVVRPPTFQFMVYPQKSGTLAIGPFSVSFVISPSLGSAARKMQLRTNGLTLDVRTPPGAADGAFVLVTPKMTTTTQYTPDATEMKAGDALERTITIEAVNVPDVLIPAVKTQKPAEFNVYPSDPLLTEIPSATDRSVTTARRVQKDSFVAISAGRADIPAQKLYWYDGKKLHTITIAGKKIRVRGTPVSHGVTQGKRVQYLVAMLVLLSVLTASSVFAYRRYLKKWRADRKERYIHSEQGRFANLQSVVKDGNITDVYSAFYAWAHKAMPEIEALGFGVIRARYPQAGAPLALLDKALQTGADFDRTQFMTGVQGLREAVTRTRRKHPHDLIESLNPV